MYKYTAKYNIHVEDFNERNHKGESYGSIPEILEFLERNNYKSIEVSEDQLIINKGSEDGCKSFIDYKAPLFKNVQFLIDASKLNDAKVIIKPIN